MCSWLRCWRFVDDVCVLQLFKTSKTTGPRLISRGAGGGEPKSRVLAGMEGVAVVYLLVLLCCSIVKKPPLKRELENQALVGCSQRSHRRLS